MHQDKKSLKVNPVCFAAYISSYLISGLVFVALLLWASLSLAESKPEVTVSNAWVRATVSGQKTSGAFMTLESTQSLTLQSASSPAADTTEIHSMYMDGDIMRMRPVSAGLALGAGKALNLQPGGYHIMLIGLHNILKAGASVPITLHFEDENGRQHSIQTALTAAYMPPEP